jgi:hypothetical protein
MRRQTIFLVLVAIICWTTFFILLKQQFALFLFWYPDNYSAKTSVRTLPVDDWNNHKIPLADYSNQGQTHLFRVTKMIR